MPFGGTIYKFRLYNLIIPSIKGDLYDSTRIGVILHISMIENLLYINYSPCEFLFDKLDYGWYITCSVNVRNKEGRTFMFRVTTKENNLMEWYQILMKVDYGNDNVETRSYDSWG